MKNYWLLILLTLTSLLTYSQDLRPDKKAIKYGDTLLCWNIDKSRIIAKKIIHQEYCDSVAKIQEEKIINQDSIICLQKESIDILGLQKKNLEMTLGLKDQQIINIQDEIKIQKFFKWGAISFGGLALILMAVK